MGGTALHEAHDFSTFLLGGMGEGMSEFDFKLFLCPYNELVTYHMIVNFFFAAAFLFSPPYETKQQEDNPLFFSICFFSASKHI
jgi:hypothetical protein